MKVLIEVDVPLHVFSTFSAADYGVRALHLDVSMEVFGWIKLDWAGQAVLKHEALLGFVLKQFLPVEFVLNLDNWVVFSCLCEEWFCLCVVDSLVVSHSNRLCVWLRSFMLWGFKWSKPFFYIWFYRWAFLLRHSFRHFHLFISPFSFERLVIF